jgi:hypothetical protein
MAVSSDPALRSYLRKELGLTNASRVPDEEIDAEIDDAKRELSQAIAYKVETGESFDFYGDDMANTLENYMKVRMVPRSSNGKGRAVGRIPSEHPRSVAQIRHTDFGDSKVNFWRDRMVHHFNRI